MWLAKACTLIALKRVKYGAIGHFLDTKVMFYFSCILRFFDKQSKSNIQFLNALFLQGTTMKLSLY